MQLGGALDSSVFGVPLVFVVAVGGVLALAAGVLLRTLVEGVRRSEPATGRSVDDLDGRGATEPARSDATDREPSFLKPPAGRGQPVQETAGGGSRAQRAGPEQSEDVARAERAENDPTGTGGGVRDVAGSAATDADTGEVTRPDDLPDLLRTATSRHAEGDLDGAIQAAYMFVRKRLAAELEISTAGTHWDFFERCVEAGLADGEDSLRELTEVYEQAAFGSGPATEHEAERAMELSGRLTDATVPDTA